MPLTPFQSALLAAMAINRSEDSYLAGAAALHFAPDSVRYSDDLDLFHDSEARVASAFAADRDVLQAIGCQVTVELSQPGFIRAMVMRAEGEATRVDWARDSAWRFLPPLRDPLGGFLLHPIDVAINKVLALVGRDEPRDFVDVLEIHATILPIPALVWAAPGKDPGVNPASLLELLRRRGRIRPEELRRLALARPLDATALRETWQDALHATERFITLRPAAEAGCLYWHRQRQVFVCPSDADVTSGDLVPHFGRYGGVLPQVAG